MATQDEMGNELLKQNGNESATTASVDVERIILRERKRVRWWAIATAGLWIITAALFFAICYVYMVFVNPLVVELLTASNENWGQLRSATFYGLSALLVWPILLFLSAACTTGFILASRRATLRQIQADLARITEQLKALAENS